MTNKTIYALSTVFGKSGVAVIRISGKDVLNVINQITNIDISKIIPRHGYYTSIFDKSTKDLLDKALIMYFNAPHSFTGEDVLEIDCHGSKAVLNSILKCLSSFPELRLAEPGEFSKRAFYNQKMDLTEADGLADLIDAETSEQQKYALRQIEGNLKNIYNSWRENLVKVLSILEAYIDFPDEDISETLNDEILNTVFKVKTEIKEHLQGNKVDERLRNGFRVAIVGKANAGKSSLINALVKRNAVIVSDIAGTTRDAIDINLDIEGYPVIITDTAGFRITDNPIEQMGINIAYEKIKQADIVIVMYDANTVFKIEDFDVSNKNVIYVANKGDLISDAKKNEILKKKHIIISAKLNEGIDQIVQVILDNIKNNFSSSSNSLITRIRYRRSLEECLFLLDNFSLDKDIELAAEDVRLACREIGTITGAVHVDEILNNIFGSFCIGK